MCHIIIINIIVIIIIFAIICHVTLNYLSDESYSIDFWWFPIFDFV